MLDLFLYAGETNSTDVLMADPTVVRGMVSPILAATGAAMGIAIGLAAARPYGATTWRGIGWQKHPKAEIPRDGELR